MKRFIGFLDSVIEANQKIVLAIEFNNGSYMYFTEEFDGYDEHDDSVELYNHHSNMILLIRKESILSYNDGEFEIAFGDTIASLSSAEVM